MVQKDPLSNQAGSQVPSFPWQGSIQNYFQSDLQFHQLFPDTINDQASMHWTPLHIARKAAAFLAADKNATILDIGSGTGKFCLAAGYYQPDNRWVGIEQRADMVHYAEIARQHCRLPNVSFLHANLTETDLSRYDHFYFFNAFYENISEGFRIDDNLDYSQELYYRYNRYLYRALEKKPPGTRLATFHSTEAEIPADYHVVATSDDATLKCWIKV
ncbi:MAG: class I SAM-dependent methyltransferase [Bacteroidota bacterium]|nr:class I SAM-dependent methyltransferase [Bacteroidota bacterium]